MKHIRDSRLYQRIRESRFVQRARPWLRALTNPHLLISFGLAWFLTNGWAYAAALIGRWLDIRWMTYIGAAYMGLLWLPGTPEKLITFPLAIVILRLLFPKDTRTLALIRRKSRRVKEKTKAEFARFRARLHHKKEDKPEQDE